MPKLSLSSFLLILLLLSTPFLWVRTWQIQQSDRPFIPVIHPSQQSTKKESEKLPVQPAESPPVLEPTSSDPVPSLDLLAIGAGVGITVGVIALGAMLAPAILVGAGVAILIHFTSRF